MSIGAIGGLAAPMPQPAVPVPSAPKGGQEVTTVTTQCNKEHWHTPACPHTVSTQPASERKGQRLDVYA